MAPSTADEAAKLSPPAEFTANVKHFFTLQAKMEKVASPF